MSIRYIRLVTVYVSDQERARRFYTEVLGFEVQTDEPFGNGARWIEVVPPGERTAFTLHKPWPGQEERVGCMAGCVLGTDDIDATYEELSQKGVNFIEKPAMQPWGVKQAIFADPDGNEFVLVER